MRTILLLAAIGTCWPAPATAQEKGYQAGVATRVITPRQLMWMAGYAARSKPAEGKLHDLYVKALAVEDPAGNRLVLVTCDLIGLPHSLSELVAEDVRRQAGLPRERLVLSTSHTHCGPVVRDNLIDMYPLSAEEAAKIGPYADQLRGWMVEAVAAALKDLKPARLSVGMGTARFAANRRQQGQGSVKIGVDPKGPVDHAVPVLKVESPAGQLRAAVFGYACHNTTLSFYQWCGDYAGFAQEAFEAKHPKTVALYWAGCGGDANPAPRGTVELARKHGQELATAVDDAIKGKLTPIAGSFTARYATVALPFDKLPTRDQLAADSLSKNLAQRKRAERLLKVLDDGGKIEDQYPHYPVQVWRLGDQVLWISLGGEAVVDYALRLKKELAGGPAVWVTAYANDVMAYIPSVRILKEGGYEADSSMIYYGLPTRWAPAVEERIIAQVHELAKTK